MRIQPNTSKLGETALAVADYAFDEPLFMTYRIVRNAHQMRFYGWCLFIVGLLLDALSVYVVSYLGITLEALGFCAVSFVLTALGVYVIASGHLGRGASKSVFADFFGRRGADIHSPRPWAFRERVIVDEEGITICYGPIGAPDDQLRMVRKAWGEWASVHLTSEALIVLCKAKTGPAARWLLGFDFAYYDQKRNTFEDTVIPLNALIGTTPQELSSYIQSHLTR